MKQFVKSKTQLDQFLNNSEDKGFNLDQTNILYNIYYLDIRNLSAAAKTLNELERLLLNPKLVEIKYVADCVTNIKLFGKNIRLLAQDRLMSSVVEKNQAAIASSLQVFYNLQSLPEVILMIIDSTVKK